MLLCEFRIHLMSGAVAQCIGHRPTEPGIARSSPAGVIIVDVPLQLARLLGCCGPSVKLMRGHSHIMTGFTTAQRAHGVVVSHPLRMRKALGSNPSGSTCLVHVCGQWHSLRTADASGLGAHMIVQTLSQTGVAAATAERPKH